MFGWSHLRERAARGWLVGLAAACVLQGGGAAGLAQAGSEDRPDDIAGMQAIRGDVIKASGGVYTVKSPAGTVYRIFTGVNTHFVAGEREADASAVKVGAFVLAGGDLDSKAGTLGAVFVAAVDRAQLAEYDERRREFGKTWLAGTVSSIKGTRLEVKRTDDVVTMVDVDEDTSFKQRHQSVTLGDLHVGDGLTARGAMGKDAFKATVVTVVDGREIQDWARLRDR